MGNVSCGCCAWRGPQHQHKNIRKVEEDSMWFEHDKTPLISARYDVQPNTSKCVVQKTIVMRSPRRVDQESNLMDESEKSRRFQRESSMETTGSESSNRDSESSHRLSESFSSFTENRDADRMSSDDEENKVVFQSKEHDEIEFGDPDRSSIVEQPKAVRAKSNSNPSANKKKTRYGRKNYRANSSRKKN